MKTTTRRVVRRGAPHRSEHAEDEHPAELRTWRVYWYRTVWDGSKEPFKTREFDDKADALAFYDELSSGSRPPQVLRLEVRRVEPWSAVE